MSRFYSVTWIEGNFNRTASILAFDSKAARAAYPAQCNQRVAQIDYKQKTLFLRDGHLIRLALWDLNNPNKFNIIG